MNARLLCDPFDGVLDRLPFQNLVRRKNELAQRRPLRRIHGLFQQGDSVLRAKCDAHEDGDPVRRRADPRTGHTSRTSRTGRAGRVVGRRSGRRELGGGHRNER